MHDLSMAEINGPWGLYALWNTPGVMVHFLLVALVIMSIGSWYLVLSRLFDQQIWLGAGRRVQKQLETVGSIAELIHGLDSRGKSFRTIAEAGLRVASEYRGRLAERVGFHEWLASSIERAVGREQRRIQAGLAMLPTVGLVGPAVGLFGTVYLLMSGLTGYAETTALLPVPNTVAAQPYLQSDKPAEAPKDGASINGPQDAEGEATTGDLSRKAEEDSAIQHGIQEHTAQLYGIIGQAMVLLLIGAFVAIPAVAGYRALLARSKKLEEALRDFASELTVRLLNSPVPPSSKGSDLAGDSAAIPAT